MKILLIAPNFREPTAWMMSAYKTALNLAKLKDVSVVVLTSQTKGSLAFEKIKGVKIYRSKAYYIPDPFNYAFTPFIFRDLARIIKKEKPNKFLINKYMFFSSLTGIYLRLIGKKYTLQTDTFPGYNWFSPSKTLNFFMWIYTRTLGYLILRLSSKIIVLYSSLVKDAKRFGLKNVVCIHNGVDLGKFTDAKGAKDILKFKNGKILITYLGRLDEVKGYRLALLLAKQINSKYKGKVKFLFVCGNKNPELRKKLTKEFAYIKFEGFRSDIASIFKASDIHILPSYTEGLPNSVMEAMAANCAVVASRVGGIPEIINEDKKEGMLFERNNMVEFSFKVQHLIMNEKLLKEVKFNGKMKIKKDFNWDNIRNEMIEEMR